jgi:ABC-type uncharacterized transport system substrate-binding protein
MAKKSKSAAKRPSRAASPVKRAKAKKAKTPPVQTKAKPKGKPKPALPVIGFLIAADPSAWSDYIAAFQNQLAQLGWYTSGGNRNVALDLQPPNGAAGDITLLSIYANAFVNNNVDVIVTSGTEASTICKNATASMKKPIPVVFASAGDPVHSGLVQQGGNVTGCWNRQFDDAVMRTRLETLKKKLKPTKVGIIGNNSVLPVNEAIDFAWDYLTQAGILVAAKQLGYFVKQDLATDPDIAAKLQTLKDDGVDVLLVISDPLLTTKMTNIVAAAKKMKMKTMHEYREAHSHHNGDQTYGPSFTALFEKAAGMVDQILRHIPVSSIPVHTPNVATYP